ncbi:hypothetical protein FACS1894187_26040 [Synergistales bacterium]|nr:hypothetical protein FACS1894187_26040 [Synergistales bacterium]
MVNKIDEHYFAGFVIIDNHQRLIARSEYFIILQRTAEVIDGLRGLSLKPPAAYNNFAILLTELHNARPHNIRVVRGHYFRFYAFGVFKKFLPVWRGQKQKYYTQCANDGNRGHISPDVDFFERSI